MQALHASGYPNRSGMTLLFACLLMLAHSFGLAAWTEENCTNKGGQIVTVGGTTFCKSTSSMNWWSAYSWCQAMGGYMPVTTDLCPGEITQQRDCPGITRPGAWSTTPCHHSGNMWATTNGTTLDCNSTPRAGYRYAYCLK